MGRSASPYNPPSYHVDQSKQSLFICNQSKQSLNIYMFSCLLELFMNETSFSVCIMQCNHYYVIELMYMYSTWNVQILKSV